MNTTYLALEAKRVLRSPRTLMFVVGMPVLYFFIFKGLYGASAGATAYLMGGMAAFGAMMGTLFTGARTTTERAVGWQRQLRLTPLTPAQYLLGKGIVGMAIGLIPVVLIAVAGVLFGGVTLGAGGWVQLVVGVWLAALPFAALGLLVGQLATTESVQIYTMSIMLLCGFLGGLWIPPTSFPLWLANVSKILPSYWMADIGHGAVLHNTQLGTAALVLGAWTIVLAAMVMVRYRRDSARR
jgi:ABC-2 type transport system permease protein